MTRASFSQWTRRAVLLAGVAALVALGEPRPAGVAAGGLLVALGEAVRLWAAGHLVKTSRLVTSGPYRFTRNPLYLGRLLIGTGLIVAGRPPWGLTPWAVAVFLFLFLAWYLPRKERVEPRRLEERHGEAFTRYRAAVPALVPRLTPWPGAENRPWSPERFRANREGWTAAVLLLLLALFAVRAA